MPGVYSTTVGYAGGNPKIQPTYELVCSGKTGYNECVRVVYNPELISYADLLRMFYESHDPTQVNGQGNDHGTQYRTGIYFSTKAEEIMANAAKKAYQKSIELDEDVDDKPIATEIVKLDKWFFAEAYHQQYLAQPGSRKYCSARPLEVSMISFDQWGTKVLENLKDDEIKQIGGEAKLPEKYWKKYGPKSSCSVTREKDHQITFDEIAKL